MKPRQRQAAILEHLQKQGKCSVEDLAHYFDTTGTTIRKDLVLLENSGAVIRTYGGVVLNKDEAEPRLHHPRDLGKLQQYAPVQHPHLELHVHHRCLWCYLRLPLHPVSSDGSLHEE